MRRPATWLAVGLCVVSAVGVGIGLALQVAGYHQGLADAPLVGFAAFAAVGLVIAVRRPRVPLGWVFLGLGVLTGLLVSDDQYLAYAAARHLAPASPTVVAALWLADWMWYPLIASTVTFTLLFFPEGLPSRRWRPVLWGTVALIVAAAATAALQPTLSFGPLHVANPVGIRAWHAASADVSTTAPFRVFDVGFGLAVAAAVSSLVTRFRRARGAEREQIKWFVLTAGLGGVLLALVALWPAFGYSDVGNVLFAFFVTAMPVSCAVAIFRYRLYDIDRIVSRTVSYAVVTGLLFGVYVGCVALFTGVLPFSGDVGTAASVLVAVALFAPLRRRVQRGVDRRFNRARYDAEATVAAFAGRLREQVDLDVVRADLLGVVHDTVAPEHASLWLRKARDGDPAARPRLSRAS